MPDVRATDRAGTTEGRGSPSPRHQRVAVFGGVYSNHYALSAVLDDAQAQGVDHIYCLGDVGGFGPHPNISVQLLRDAGVPTIQGNYDDSVGNQLDDCQCGYTDPRDNHYATLSYEYTLRNTSEAHREWFRGLPKRRSFDMGGRRVLLAHGSPRRTNEFLWESMTPRPFIERLLEEEGTDLIFVTHSGLPWFRFVEPGRGIVNVGAIGRPANDGDPRVVYAVLEHLPAESMSEVGAAIENGVGTPSSEVVTGDLRVEFRRVTYDYESLANEMRSEELPEEFVETILTGWWTTCLEILPGRERERGKY